IWPWLANGAKQQRWVSWMVEVRGPSPNFSRPGDKRVLVMKDENNGSTLMEIEATCADFVSPDWLHVRLASQGMFSGSQDYRLTPLGNGRTRLEIQGKYEYSMWMARLMEPLVTPAAQAKMVKDLATLKSLVESSHAETATR